MIISILLERFAHARSEYTQSSYFLAFATCQTLLHHFQPSRMIRSPLKHQYLLVQSVGCQCVLTVHSPPPILGNLHLPLVVSTRCFEIGWIPQMAMKFRCILNDSYSHDLDAKEKYINSCVAILHTDHLFVINRMIILKNSAILCCLIWH